MKKQQGFLVLTGGYRNLRVYKLAEAIHDLTMVFVRRFIERGSRTKDQMEQAARSGKQNIAEGSKVSFTSREMEIKLTNVAKASLEELLIDYEDYLRQHELPIWSAAHPRFSKMREFLCTNQFLDTPTALANKLTAEEFCNLCITLINQTTYLLGRLLIAQQKQFLENGGIREQMTRARTAARRSDRSDKSDKSEGKE